MKSTSWICYNESMTKNTYLIIGLVFVLVIVGFVLVRQGGKNEALAPTSEEVSMPTASPASTSTPTQTPPVVAPATKTITYTDSGFSPATLTIKAGDTVLFKNNGSKDFWPASAPHPTHTNYPEFDAKKGIAPGASYSFTFTRIGSWKYHNHLNPTANGTITVQ